MGKKSKKPKAKHGNARKERIVNPVAAAAVGSGTNFPPRPPPAPVGATCWICLDGQPDDDGMPIVRDCSCRGDDAGFAHLSCLVNYAETKTREKVEAGGMEDDLDIIGLWARCPNCRQDYQRQVALDMAKALLLHIDVNHPGDEIRKIGAYSMIQNTIFVMDYREHPELREQGRYAATKTISAIQNFCESEVDANSDDFYDHLLFAYGAMAKLAEVEHTKEGYDMSLQYYNKVRDMYREAGDETGLRSVEFIINIVKGKLKGGGEEPFSEEMFDDMRDWYETKAREEGENAADSVQAGLNLAQSLYNSRRHGLESERLYAKLAVISRRVYGPEHHLTKKCQLGLECCKCRRLRVTIDHNGSCEYHVVRFDDEEGGYALTGPISNPRTPHKERILSAVSPARVSISNGTPVICHGLKNAAHLNGEVGDCTSFDEKTGRHAVQFEDKRLKSALVKRTNLIILIDISDKK